MSKNKITRAEVDNYFDDTLLGPRGLLSRAFRHKVKVPTLEEAKAERAQYKNAPQSNYAKKGSSILRKALKAVKKRKTLEGQMNEIVQQMQKLSSAIDKKEKGSKLFHNLLAYAEKSVNKSSSQRMGVARGGGRARRRRGTASRVKRGGMLQGDDGGGVGGNIVPHQAPVGQGGVRAALAEVLARYRELVRTGQGQSNEAVQLLMQVRLMQIMVREDEQMEQHVRLGRVRAVAPYIISAAAIALAAWTSYSIVMGIEGFAAGATALGGGALRFAMVVLIDMVIAIVSSMPGSRWWMAADAVAGEAHVANATARFVEYAGPSFERAAAEGARGLFGVEVAVGIILFMIFVVLQALAFLTLSARRIRLGWGAIEVERDDPFGAPAGGLGGHIPAHQLPGGQPAALPAPAPPFMIANAPHAVAPAVADDDEVAPEVEHPAGGGRRRRRRRTKKRGRGRKGRSRKRVKRKMKRRRTRQRRKRGRRRRMRSRR